MPYIQTVCGPIAPEDLGPTLMHEHVLWDIRPPSWKDADQGPLIDLSTHWPINYGEVKAPRNYQLDQVDVAASEMTELYNDGGRAVVELSCGGLSPDPEGLVAVSKQSGVHVVMGCGHYVDEYQAEENENRSVDAFAEEMVAQMREGAWGTAVRAGILGEIGCQSPWTALEKRVMKAAVLAQHETDATISVHPGRDPDQPQEVADFLLAEGADMSRVVMSHIDRTIFDEDRLYRLADTGVVVEWDLFGQENSYYFMNEAVDMPNDAVRLKWMRKLVDRGQISQITISHDICYRTRLRKFGGHGYGHIFRNVIPLMRRRGWSEAQIDTVILETPRRLLTLPDD
ncbi:MAG: aryldialkylphosphatase [Pseudomonadota bacterium]